MFESKKSTRQKALEKERKQKHTRKYGRVRLKHSHMGIHSCWYALGAYAVLAAAVIASFLKHGQSPAPIGGVGMLSAVLAVLGFKDSVIGLRERERNYITCRIGMVTNIIILLLLLLIFIGGLM